MKAFALELRSFINAFAYYCISFECNYLCRRTTFRERDLMGTTGLVMGEPENRKGQLPNLATLLIVTVVL